MSEPLNSPTDLVGKSIVAVNTYGGVSHIHLSDGSLLCVPVDEMYQPDGRLLINPEAAKAAA